ncbi:nitrite reductase large subunit NirB [Jeotgalibacillus proteolyticus]|uniref:Nitrite reductase large subunit n=1 Tax=Jeotgalibacillus proteolyticus TaxID=2082395 RepID=A0A2S5GDD0_9BACL|nr:nitrite reductase large subunit NirB [Jeotgalibacillus proteolyticus]PPA70999.1 nitrite reductase large subunit [Jeotgalibacillus proteolyticus]
MKKQKLVLIGNGMAGVRAVEEVLKLDSEGFDVTVFGSEPYPNYNRIQLSKVLQGDTEIADITLNTWEWYEENGILLYPGETVTSIDTVNQTIVTDKERQVSYDKLILATGSVPFMLPLPGADKEGVTAFRNIEDCERMIEASLSYKKAIVIGGGLLGLEAARGLLNLGMEVDVVHNSNTLMDRQLDNTAGKMLQKELEKQGMNFLLEKQSAEIVGESRVEGLRFEDGEVVKTDLVVMAVGIRSNMKLAEESGIPVNRGILVNDHLETEVPNVFAVGECAEHKEMVYGLVAPLYQQGKEMAKRICGETGNGYQGSVLSTQLKVSGVDVFSAGQIIEEEETKSVTLFDDWRGVYKKVLVNDGKITGAVLFGDTKEGTRLLNLINKRAPIEEYMDNKGAEEAGADLIASMPDTEMICGCNGVTKGAIVEAINAQGLTTVDQVKGCTNASRSCGGCKPLVSDLLAHTAGDAFEQNQKESICACTSYSKEEVMEEIKAKGLTYTKEVMNVLGWSSDEGCSKCRPALNYYLGMLNPAEYHDEKESRYVNERLHANIQKNGTYSVVPRMYGGVTNADDLRKIADVADKYKVPLIKVTGGQRIDLFGVKKEDLPNVWSDLDMPSGSAYAKGLRTVKTCVGADYCRFGTKDSMGLGIKLEKKFEGLNTPHKVKMSVSACPRNCAEGSIKDVGITGLDGEFEIYVGGNGGTHLRKANLLAKVKTEEEVLETTAGFLQYYRETADYLDRTSAWVEKMGLDHIKSVLANKKTFIELNHRMDEALSVVQDGWKQALEDKTLLRDLYQNLKVPAGSN